MDGLAAHLADRYGVPVERLVELDHEVFRVDGPSWVARRFPPEAVEAVSSTAETLRRLAATPFPAERLAHDEPVSVFDDHPVLVTEFVPGAHAPPTRRVFAGLGGLLGALNARAATTMPPGGGWHHLVPQGTVRDEIAAALSMVENADGDPAARQTLGDELRALDDYGDLPYGFVHPDFVPVNAIRSPEGGLTIVDWVGSGRGPRLWSIGFLLYAAGAHNLALVDAVLEYYRRHVDLTPAELERLPDAIRARPLTLDCWSAAHGRVAWATAVERLDPLEDLAEHIADRARGFLAG